MQNELGIAQRNREAVELKNSKLKKMKH